MKRGRGAKNKQPDQLLRACPACAALIGQGCNHSIPLPLIPRASRLVHAARLDHQQD